MLPVVIISSMIQENESWFETSEGMSNITNFSTTKVHVKAYSDCPTYLSIILFKPGTATKKGNKNDS